MVGIDIGFLIYPVFLGLFAASAAFVGVLLPSHIINLLIQGKPASEIVQIAIIGAVVIFILTSLSDVSMKYDYIYNFRCWRIYYGKVSSKAMELDYAQLESPLVTTLRQRMKDDDNWGSSVGAVFSRYRFFAAGLFQAVFSIWLLVPLLLNPVVYKSVVFYAGILLMVALAVLVYLVDTRVLKKRLLKIQDELSGCDKLFHHFIFANGITYQNGKDIRVYGAGDLIWDKLDAVNKSVKFRLQKRMTHTTGLSNGLRNLLTGVVQGGAYVIVIIYALKGAFGIGELVRYAGGIFAFFKALTIMLHNIGDVSVLTKRQKSTMDYFELEEKTRSGTRKINKSEPVEVEFRGVSFKYPGTDTYVINNFSHKIELGKKIALVGVNGAGKTTLIKLLCRLYEPTEGHILLNGVDIAEYSYEEYLELFSVVFQDFRLFAFTLGQNVAASFDYDSEAATQALNKAKLGGKLSAMKNGLETILYHDIDLDGVEISGGEAQKIALARAIYKNAPVIILDEPTAALDPIAEYEMYTSFNDIIGEKTAVYISHRLSSCRFCDRILVLEDGMLIESGTHDELLGNEGGRYYELWTTQAKHYQE